MSVHIKKVRSMLYQLGFKDAPAWAEDKLREVSLAAVGEFDGSTLSEQNQKTFRIVRKYRRSGDFMEITRKTKKG